MALVAEYFELTQKYVREYGVNTILLMQVGAFFEVYGLGLGQGNDLNVEKSQINEFAKICDLNIGDKKSTYKQYPVTMAGFSLYMIDKYIKKLQDAGYTIVIYTQKESDKTVRELSEIYSPGTYFTLDSTSQMTNNITCVWINVQENRKNGNKQVIVGLANIDIYTGKSSIFEFSEIYINNPTTFDELERFISIYLPVEVILIYNISEKEINDILNYTNISAVKSIHKVNILSQNVNSMITQALNSEKQTYQKTILEKFFKMTDIFYQNVIATQAYCVLLDFINQHNPDLINNIQEPFFENCSERLILANHSLKQLNIIDDGEKGPFSSVEKLVNICHTQMGKRQFSHHLLNPTTNIHYLQTEYDITDYIISNYTTFEYLKFELGQIKDISKIHRQIMLKRISPKILFQLSKNVLSISTIREKHNSDVLLNKYLNSRIVECSHLNKHCSKVVSFLDSVFILEECESIDTYQSFDQCFIKKGVNKELDNKIKLLDESREKLEAIRLYLNECIRKVDKNGTSEYIKIHETEKNNFSLVATKRRCATLKQYFASLTVSTQLIKYNEEYNKTFQLDISQIHFETQSTSNDAICSEQITELCKNISSTKIIMKDLILNVYIDLIKQLSQDFIIEFETIIQFISIIDVIFSKATLAKRYNYCKPTICKGEGTLLTSTILTSTNQKSFVNAIGLRHCLVEHIQQNELYVSNDISLGTEERKDELSKAGILLYGTNAVGKTSFIKSIGIAIIMAQAGLYVPCTSFEYSPYKYIFTRILGNDNIFKNLSTFAVEMSELRTILRLADNNSLVLGDELCSGTESISAVAIFVAGIKTLYEKQCSFIFATHLHEIIHYEEIQCTYLKHMSVIFDRHKNILVYDRKLKEGPGNNMYGLEVCKSLNLPEEFLKLAHDIRIKYNRQYGSVLSLKQSHYNSKKLIGVCEQCNIKMGTEVHHIHQQKEANADNIIIKDTLSFHKNHLANLMTLCEKCHQTIHSY